MATPPATPPNPKTTNFDIVPHYHNLLTTDPTLTPPIAAIESLVSLLSSSPITTISETLNLISRASTTLLRSQRNPIPVGAGTDLFQRYLITSFQNTPIPSQSGSDFTQLRNQLISNSKVFVARAKSARRKIASYALPLIRDESVVVTYGSSRVVGNLLAHAADAGRWFRVVQVMPSTSSTVSSQRITAQVNGLRKAGIEVATVPLASLSFALNSLAPSMSSVNSGNGSSTSTMVVLGTSAVLENGAAVSEMGCYLVAQIAKMHGMPLYVATESYKFARQFPVAYGARDLEKMGTKQEVLKFTASASTSASQGQTKESDEEQSVDVTPPALISGLITENGVMTPNAVAEELIKLWF